ncbi:hypothetical protein ACH42_12685 [Endozoicomonas sp. (ex Bugula neritina AB1)]|nr:hypothetical protein ACH42_12685 [Endozoicomonas sp. (ex Bugula neritina AB1)]
MDIGRDVIRGLKVGTILRLAAQIFTWINTLILIRLLTPDDYGLMAMTMAFIGIFALMGDVGIGKAIIQSEELSHQRLRQAFTINIMSCLIFFLSFYAVAPFIASFFSEPKVTVLIQVIACQHLIMILHTLPYSMASRKMLFKEREKVQFYTTLCTSIFTLTLAFNGFGVWALVYGHLFMRLVATIGYNIIAPCWIKPTINFQGFSKIAGFSGLATVNDMLRYLYNVFSNISIGKLLSNADLGVFSVARNLANLPSDKMGELLNHLGLASFAKLQNEKEVAGLYLLKSFRLAGLILFPMYLGMCAISPELIEFTLSDTWLAVIVPFQILCLASPFRMLSELLATAATAVGKPIKNTRALFASLLMLPIILAGIEYGLEGACWAWLIITIISFSMHMKIILPVFQVSLTSLFTFLLPGMASAVIMLAGLQWMRFQLDHSIESWLLLTLMIPAGMGIFIAMILLLFRNPATEAIRYLRHQ